MKFVSFVKWSKCHIISVFYALYVLWTKPISIIQYKLAIRKMDNVSSWHCGKTNVNIIILFRTLGAAPIIYKFWFKCNSCATAPTSNYSIFSFFHLISSVSNKSASFRCNMKLEKKCVDFTFAASESFEMLFRCSTVIQKIKKKKNNQNTSKQNP